VHECNRTGRVSVLYFSQDDVSVIAIDNKSGRSLEEDSGQSWRLQVQDVGRACTSLSMIALFLTIMTVIDGRQQHNTWCKILLCVWHMRHIQS